MTACTLVKRTIDEFRKGGLKHLVLSPLELAFLSLLRNIPPLHERLSHRYYIWRRSDDVCRYDCPPDPFKIERVSPEHIQYWTGREQAFFNRRTLFGAVADGDWDRATDPFDESMIHRSLKQRFVGGRPWEETTAVRTRLQRIDENDGSFLQFNTREEVMERCRKNDRLFERIQSEGYKSQSEILDDNEHNPGLFPSELDEITVDVGRNGELLLVDGRHRLSIAKILELEEIPVVFLVRHEGWMEYREELCNSGEPIPDHPDLRDLK